MSPRFHTASSGHRAIPSVVCSPRHHPLLVLALSLGQDEKKTVQIMLFDWKSRNIPNDKSASLVDGKAAAAKEEGTASEGGTNENVRHILRLIRYCVGYVTLYKIFLSLLLSSRRRLSSLLLPPFCGASPLPLLFFFLLRYPFPSSPERRRSFAIVFSPKFSYEFSIVHSATNNFFNFCLR
jgi:hypothetical protein